MPPRDASVLAGQALEAMTIIEKAIMKRYGRQQLNSMLASTTTMIHSSSRFPLAAVSHVRQRAHRVFRPVQKNISEYVVQVLAEHGYSATKLRGTDPLKFGISNERHFRGKLQISVKPVARKPVASALSIAGALFQKGGLINTLARASRIQYIRVIVTLETSLGARVVLQLKTSMDALLSPPRRTIHEMLAFLPMVFITSHRSSTIKQPSARQQNATFIPRVVGVIKQHGWEVPSRYVQPITVRNSALVSFFKSMHPGTIYS